MRVLLYSMVLYLLGIAVILYVRPSYMFRENGQWKDFGIHNRDTTLFPIWMFCILWAIISYMITRMVFPVGASAALAATVVKLSSHLPDTTPTETPSPSPSKMITENSKPGYYKLSDSTMKKNGVPRYIYIGEEKPSDLED